VEFKNFNTEDTEKRGERYNLATSKYANQRKHTVLPDSEQFFKLNCLAGVLFNLKNQG